MTSNSAGGTKSNLEGSRRYCVYFGSQTVERQDCVLDRRVFPPGSYSPGRYIEIPYDSQHTHSGETRTQRIVTEIKVWRVGVDAGGNLSLTPGFGMSWEGSPVFLQALALRVESVRRSALE